jgi:hypothetical protein
MLFVKNINDLEEKISYLQKKKKSICIQKKINEMSTFLKVQQNL